MKRERVILSFVMIIIGLLVAGGLFYFYQSTKIISPTKLANGTVNQNPTPTPSEKIYLVLNQPSDESVVTNKTLSVSGKTTPGATVAIITNSDQQIINPTSLGDFTTTITLDDGENIIHVQTILPDGQTNTIVRTVTYSTESF